MIKTVLTQNDLIFIQGTNQATVITLQEGSPHVAEEVEIIMGDSTSNSQQSIRAIVDSVTQKKLSSVTSRELEAILPGQTIDSLLQWIQRNIDDKVKTDNVVSIVNLSLLDNNYNGKHLTKITTHVSEVSLFVDGGSRGNPGPSASGYVIYDEDKNVLLRQGNYIGVTTNNQAEYLALKFGLEQAVRYQPKKIHVHMDSLLVINQMLGKFKIKNRDLWPIHTAIKELINGYHVSFTHVPRELNKEADAVVNEVLDSEIPSRTL